MVAQGITAVRICAIYCSCDWVVCYLRWPVFPKIIAILRGFHISTTLNCTNRQSAFRQTSFMSWLCILLSLVFAPGAVCRVYIALLPSAIFYDILLILSICVPKEEWAAIAHVLNWEGLFSKFLKLNTIWSIWNWENIAAIVFPVKPTSSTRNCKAFLFFFFLSKTIFGIGCKLSINEDG